MKEIQSETWPIVTCPLGVRNACFDLLSQSFLGISRDKFDQDFDEKEVVVVLRRLTDQTIVGFSTLMQLRLPTSSGEITAIFSGDTAVLPRYRNTFEIIAEIGRYFLRVRETHPTGSVYYVLISKGWRTYRIMPFTFHEFFPVVGTATPPYAREIIDAFGRAKYPNEYQSTTGLLIFHEETQRIRPDSIDAIPVKRDPHTEFFLRANPGYLKGNELVCIGRIDPDNFTPQLRKLLALPDSKE